MSERQLRRFFEKARKLGTNAGDELLKFCERRLDNAIRRAGMCKTRPQARQGIAHGHFLVNGKKCKVASRILRVGDLIQVRPKVSLVKFYQSLLEQISESAADWLSVDPKTLSARVSYPLRCPT